MLVASKTVLYSLRLGELNRMGFSIVQPEVRFGQNDVPYIYISKEYILLIKIIY
jgi:hypothetical protein